MILRYATLLVLMLILATSCMGETQSHEEPMVTDPSPQYEYKVGLGYGFLGKSVQVMIDDREVISVIGTDEIEGFAQLQGTKMLATGSSPNKEILVRVIIDGGQPYEQAIDLSAGMFVHIYQEQTGMHVYNTNNLILE